MNGVAAAPAAQAPRPAVTRSARRATGLFAFGWVGWIGWVTSVLSLLMCGSPSIWGCAPTRAEALSLEYSGYVLFGQSRKILLPACAFYDSPSDRLRQFGASFG